MYKLLLGLSRGVAKVFPISAVARAYPVGDSKKKLGKIMRRH